jgi:xylulose-5-phosphate/fructose-6-phosphate phosphoketolase
MGARMDDRSLEAIHDVLFLAGPGHVEEGATTTPFDMVVLNHMSRFHLAIEALRRARRRPHAQGDHIFACEEALDRHRRFVLEHFEDMPEVQGWTWSR